MANEVSTNEKKKILARKYENTVGIGSTIESDMGATYNNIFDINSLKNGVMPEGADEIAFDRARRFIDAHGEEAYESIVENVVNNVRNQYGKDLYEAVYVSPAMYDDVTVLYNENIKDPNSEISKDSRKKNKSHERSMETERKSRKRFLDYYEHLKSTNPKLLENIPDEANIERGLIGFIKHNNKGQAPVLNNHKNHFERTLDDVLKEHGSKYSGMTYEELIKAGFEDEFARAENTGHAINAIERKGESIPENLQESNLIDEYNRIYGPDQINKVWERTFNAAINNRANDPNDNPFKDELIENEYRRLYGDEAFEQRRNGYNDRVIQRREHAQKQEEYDELFGNENVVNNINPKTRKEEIKEVTKVTINHLSTNENSPLIGAEISRNVALDVNDGRRFGMTQDWQNPGIEGVIKSYPYPINGPTREAANMPPSSSGLNTIDPEVLKNIEENTRNNKNVPENKSPEDIDVNEEEIDPEIYDTIMNAGNGDPDIVTVNGEEVDPEIYETIMNAGNGERGFRTLDTNRSIDLDDDGNAYIKFGEERIPLRRGENGFYMETGKDGRRVNLGFDDEVLGEFDALGAKFEAKEKIGPKPRSQRKSGQTSISGDSKKNIKNTEARENTFKHKAVNAKKAAKEALENSSPSLKRYLTKTGLFSLGFNLFNFKSTYDESRQEGNGVISSAARGGLDFALGEVLGVGGYLGVTIAKELPTYAVKGLEEGAKMIREKNSMKRHEAFAYSSFQDTQQLATMRQSGMEMAKMANYNLQQTLMGTEAKFLHR